MDRAAASMANKLLHTVHLHAKRLAAQHRSVERAGLAVGMDPVRERQTVSGGEETMKRSRILVASTASIALLGTSACVTDPGHCLPPKRFESFREGFELILVLFKSTLVRL